MLFLTVSTRARSSLPSVRNYCGEALPEGLVKNAKLPRNMLTPTTKAEDHDEPISPGDIVKRGLMTQAEWEETSALALKLFAFGQEKAAKNGLLLVDTKYEFGRDVVDGKIRLIDEVHTPDSSRYWVGSTYAQRHAEGAREEQREGGGGGRAGRVREEAPETGSVTCVLTCTIAGRGLRPGAPQARSPRTSTRSSSGSGSRTAATRTRTRFSQVRRLGAAVAPRFLDSCE